MLRSPESPTIAQDNHPGQAPRAASTARLTLLCHAPTPATRIAAFPADESLDVKGRRAATALAGCLPKASRVLCGPARRTRETASALGLSAHIEPALRDCDYGRWSGLSLTDVAASEPEAIGQWLVDPDAAPHGGESISAVLDRIGVWLDAEPLKGRVLAVTHVAVMRAAVVHVLGAPASAFWRIDVGPLSTIELRRNGPRWALHAKDVAAGSTK